MDNLKRTVASSGVFLGMGVAFLILAMFELLSGLYINLFEIVEKILMVGMFISGTMCAIFFTKFKIIQSKRREL